MFVSVLAMVVSCDSPETITLRELSRVGIEPSGRALVEAVTEGDVKNAKLLLDLKVHTGQRDENGNTPLSIAVAKEDVEMASMLIKAGADPNAEGSGHASILGLAFGKGLDELAAELISAGADPMGLLPDGSKIFPWAIRSGKTAEVLAMLSKGADPHHQDIAGNPMLHVAVSAGEKEIATALIRYGADPASTDPEGNGILALAVKNSWMRILPELAAAGADPNLPAPDGLTLLEQAIVDGDITLIPLLMRIGADPVRQPTTEGGVTPLEAAINTGKPEILAAMLLPGERLDTPEWSPALWVAYETDNLSLARLLLSRGAAAHKPGANGLLLTEVATLAGNVTWLKLLFDYGHAPGRSIYYASRNGDFLTAGFLLSCGTEADYTALPSFDTALSAAMRGGHDKVAVLLLRHGAKAGLWLPEKQKPLHLAIVTGNAATVRELLAAGADPNEAVTKPVSEAFLKHVKSKDMKWYLARDRNITPLMLAANTGNLTIARALLDAGASKNTYTRVNYTWPINFASRRSDVPMMRLLLGQDPHKIERHIILSLGEQRARMYDADGEEIFSSRVSSGKSGFRTRQGVFVITDKHRDHTSNLYDASMPFFQRLSCSDFGFHYGNLPGYPASHGCIRMPWSSAKKLFSMTRVGDKVTIKP
ncbi:MAG: ankyrin repeat domain-containing protein [Luteolibacter sp.]